MNRSPVHVPRREGEGENRHTNAPILDQSCAGCCGATGTTPISAELNRHHSIRLSTLGAESDYLGTSIVFPFAIYYYRYACHMPFSYLLGNTSNIPRVLEELLVACMDSILC